jgi:cyanophycinase-like exopeptidase
MSLIVVMGSGETAPTMVRVHRDVFAATPPGRAVMLDTTFGFQLNADELVARTHVYFADSVGKDVEVARWRRADAPSVEKEKALALLAQATWAFAGPGSPTFALRQWLETPVPGALVDVVRRGGTVVMGSAAAVTLGVSAIPVYEIYKAGAEPYWADGLDLLGRLTGIPAVVIPHYDNAEGGTHDTRFCYLGEQRLASLEHELPDDVGILGVDEHTSLVLDVDARVATVMGNRTVTVRRRGDSREFVAGSALAFDELTALLAGKESLPAKAFPGPRTAAVDNPLPASLREVAQGAHSRFDGALAVRDVDGCVGAILDLEEAIVAWESDTLQSTDLDDARRTLRSLIVRLGALAEAGAHDPRDVLAPFVSALLELRAKARSAGDFATSDEIRQRLAAAGVEVRDTADGVEWAPPGESAR